MVYPSTPLSDDAGNFHVNADIPYAISHPSHCLSDQASLWALTYLLDILTSSQRFPPISSSIVKFIRSGPKKSSARSIPHAANLARNVSSPIVGANTNVSCS
jgi:hypothetical protein